MPETSSRPSFPRRAVITGGMPYGNKNLHFGHIGGVFVPADFFARFLRDRIGAENVIFVSGTDCYGSPIAEGYRKKVENEGYTGTIEDYVRVNHESQKAALDAYGISLDLFAGSGLAPARDVHARVTDELIRRLHERGYLKKRSTRQFYDVEAGTFLNGRQVQGRCPVRGCKSEKAYADECDLGHQFDPEELIAPVSQVSGTTPELRPVDNWYFDLPAFREELERRLRERDWRPQALGPAPDREAARALQLGRGHSPVDVAGDAEREQALAGAEAHACGVELLARLVALLPAGEGEREGLLAFLGLCERVGGELGSDGVIGLAELGLDVNHRVDEALAHGLGDDGAHLRVGVPLVHEARELVRKGWQVEVPVVNRPQLRGGAGDLRDGGDQLLGVKLVAEVALVGVCLL